MILQAALFLAGLTVVSGSICCAPKQFNALQYVTFVNSTTTLRALYYIVYDGVNQRYLITGDRSDNLVGKTKVIYDYKKRIAYSIDTSTRSCTTFPVHGNFEDQENVCVPSGAEYLGPLFYGYNQDRLNSRSYEYNSTAPDGSHRNVVTTVSLDDDCVPVVICTISTGGPGGNSLYTLGYNDFYPGIRDITVFDIPSYCP